MYIYIYALQIYCVQQTCSVFFDDADLNHYVAGVGLSPANDSAKFVTTNSALCKAQLKKIYHLIGGSHGLVS